MIMTEEEAATKWCPHTHQMVSINRAVPPPPGLPVSLRGAAQQEPYIAVAANRWADGKGGVQVTHCLGSTCTQWQWRTRAHDEAMEHYEAAAPKGESTPPAPTGYCGLAGIPEEDRDAPG